MVKIEPVWEGMENSCSLGLGAREVDGQARTWTGNSGIRSSEHTLICQTPEVRARKVGEEYGILQCSKFRGPYIQCPACVCINRRGNLEV